MLRPDIQWANPVMFVVEVGAVLTLLFMFAALVGQGGAAPVTYFIALDVWLFLTVLFANFATALAEARGKAQAESLRRTRRDTPAYRLQENGNIEEITSTALKTGDRVVVEAGQIIPGDGEIIEGIASVDESAITGESAPVIREAGGDRSGVTGGTMVLSDRIVVRITAGAGESFLDRMIALVEGAIRQRTPNEIALTLVLSAFTLIFLIVVVPLWPMAWNAEQYMMGYLGISEPLKSLGTDVPTLVALLVCLIPTTIGALLAAIGIAGMDRALQANIIAKSGKAVETAGDIDTVLLDKTGTITIGNRHATQFMPVGAIHRGRVRAPGGAWRPSPTRRPKARASSACSTNELCRHAESSRCRRKARVRGVHRADPHERHRSGRRPRRSARARRTPSLSYVQEQGREVLRSACNAQVDAVASKGATPLVVAEGPRDRRRRRARRYSEAGHPRAVRAAAAHGAAHRDDHRRQPAHGRHHRQAGRRRRLRRPGHARSQARLHPQGAGRGQAGRDDGRRHQRRPGAGAGRRRPGHELRAPRRPKKPATWWTSTAIRPSSSRSSRSASSC